MTRRDVVVSAGVLALSGCKLLAQTRPTARKLQVLIITGREDHDWRGATELMRAYLAETGIFEIRTAEEFRDADAGAFRGYDVAILAYSDKAPGDRWSVGSQNALLEFVHSGKGLVVYHHSTTAFKDWPAFGQLCGGNFYGKAQHAELHDFDVQFTDSEHPITRGLKRSFRQSKDELYANMQMQPEDSYHVLATAWDDYALYRGESKVPLVGAGRNEPLLWTVNAGSGRVFTTVIGHSPEAMQSAGFRVTFTRGVEWAATGSVTQRIPVEMSE